MMSSTSLFTEKPQSSNREMEKKGSIAFIVLVFFSAIIFSSCKSAKEVLYVQDIENNSSDNLNFFEPKIQPGDLLSITVNAQNNELAAPFNLHIVSSMGENRKSVGGYYLQGYLVSTKGTINFPILGELSVIDLTTYQLSQKIKNEIMRGNYIKDPVVVTTFQNFKISVLGEVNRPGSFSVPNERITLFDALGLAGDMTIYGRRDNVIVIREHNGERQVFVQDLRSKEIFNSPCYYLAQNDVVIVNPNRTKIQMGGINQNNNVGVWVSLVGSVTSISTLIMTVVRNSQNK